MIKPAEKRIIVKLVDKDSGSKLFLSNESMMEHNLEYGEVVEGSDKYKAGTRVYYSKYSTARINDGGQELFIIPEIDVMAYDA